MISQKVVKKKIEKEMGRSSSQPWMGEVSRRNCGRCSNARHDSRTCEEEGDVTKEFRSS
jgi:hypothetical protein